MFRTIMIVAWCVFLFVCTCAQNFELLVTSMDIHFRLLKYPEWHQLFILPSVDFSGGYLKWYLIQKVGHFCGFAVLSALLTNFGQNKRGLILAIGYAILTEILQLFFSRDGRLVDVGIDSSGILLAYLAFLLNRRYRYVRIG